MCATPSGEPNLSNTISSHIEVKIGWKMPEENEKGSQPECEAFQINN